MKVLFFVALVIAAVVAEPEAEASADASPEAGTDVITVILDTTEDTMDMADATDTPTDMDTDILMDTTILERDLLTLNPKLPLKLPQRPKPNPGTDITVMVDTMDIPTDTTDIPVLTMVVTGGNFLPFPKVLPFFNPPVSFL